MNETEEKSRGLELYSALLPEERGGMTGRTKLHELVDLVYKAVQPGLSEQTLAAAESKSDIIPPPSALDFDLLAALFDMEVTHKACCVLKARAITAGGHRLVRKDEEPEDPPAGLVDYLDQVAEEGLERLLYRAHLDLEVLGNAYIEVTRQLGKGLGNDLGKIASVHNVPAFTIRLLPPGHNTGCAFVQEYAGKRVYYRKAGEKEPRSLPNQPVVNELVHIKEASPSSYWYGIPNIVGALRAVIGSLVGMDYAISLLEKRGMPHYIVFLPGGKNFIDEKDQTTLSRFVNEMLTSAGAGRILLVPLPSGIEAVVQQLNLNIPIKDLQEHLNECRDQIARVHAVPPRLLSILESGRLGGTGEGTTQIEQFKMFTVRPAQRLWENVLGRLLLESNPEWAGWRLRLGEFDFNDIVRQMQAYTGYVKAGMLDIDEARARLGWPPRGAQKLVFLLGGEPVLVDDVMSGEYESPQDEEPIPTEDENVVQED